MIKSIEKHYLSSIPRLFETDDLGIPDKEKIVHLHFYSDTSHWYAVEYDGKNLFYGFEILDNDIKHADWEEFSFSDMQLLSESEDSAEIIIDEDWVPVKAESVELIKKANNW